MTGASGGQQVVDQPVETLRVRGRDKGNALEEVLGEPADQFRRAIEVLQPEPGNLLDMSSGDLAHGGARSLSLVDAGLLAGWVGKTDAA